MTVEVESLIILGVRGKKLVKCSLESNFKIANFRDRIYFYDTAAMFKI